MNDEQIASLLQVNAMQQEELAKVRDANKALRRKAAKPRLEASLRRQRELNAQLEVYARNLSAAVWIAHGLKEDRTPSVIETFYDDPEEYRG